MKKNTMMRIASVLLVVVLLTTSVISGTFAKYVTSGKAGDSARVAKFGVKVVGTGEYFADEYDAGVATKTVITSGAVGDAIVAPGTSKAGVNTIVITGQPEVSTRVTFTGSVTLNDKWTTTGSDFYCPIIVTIKDKDGAVKAAIDGSTYASAAEFETAIETYINNFSAEYAPKTLLDNEANSIFSLSWEWPFSIDNVKDAKDTILGDKAAENVANAGTIEIKVDVLVEQID